MGAALKLSMNLNSVYFSCLAAGGMTSETELLVSAANNGSYTAEQRGSSPGHRLLREESLDTGREAHDLLRLVFNKYSILVLAHAG